MTDCIVFPGGVLMIGTNSGFSDEEIEIKRRELARRYRVRLAQITDEDAAAALAATRGEK